jgi:hypothetical protein
MIAEDIPNIIEGDVLPSPSTVNMKTDKKGIASVLDTIDGSTEKRAIARKLHETWGITDQITSLVELIANSIPADKQIEFKNHMYGILKLDEIEKMAVDSAVESFTKEELDAMLAYYSSDIAQSAEPKRAKYNEKLMPQIKKMIDQGMLDATASFQEFQKQQN